MRTAAFQILVLGTTLTGAATAQTIYHATPDWRTAQSPFSTGAALVDLNRDGWLDLVIANGNDMSRGHVEVYYNRGDGTFATTPDWESGDIAFNGHLDVADVNGDGWPDVVVAVLLNENGPPAKIYMNHDGTLSSLPEWTAAEIAPSFMVAFADANGDGRPDLAIGTGNNVYPELYRNTLHLNYGGLLEPNATWESADTYCYMGVLWTDGDDDGWLDLVGLGSSTYNWLYHNLGGTLEPNATWHTTDTSSQMPIMATAGDVTGSGRRALIVTDNRYMGGTGYFRQYNGVPGGLFNTTPDWSYTSSADANGSAVALADVNTDGHLDLAIGCWWAKSAIFFNTGTGFATAPTWRSGSSSVVEKIVFGDLGNRGLRTLTEHFAGGSPARHLFYLAHQPLQSVVSVHRDGVELLPSQYTYSREHGWVSVGPAAGDVDVEYTYSLRLDMVVVNWNSIGNFIYYNQRGRPGDMDCSGAVDFGDINPFVLALADPAGYTQQYPTCDLLNGDCNGDGRVDFGDINPFVELLTRR